MERIAKIMNNAKQILKLLSVLSILLTLVVTTFGLCSFNTGQAYEAVNQYGENIRMWGSGIYSHDSYFKAPIFIGSDFTILIFVVPLTIITFWKTNQKQTIEYLIRSFSISSLLLYYAASLAFGVTYNHLHLVYIALFSVCLFSVSLMFAKLHSIDIQQPKVCLCHYTKGMKFFLLISGISLFSAWLPDIIISITKGTSLEIYWIYFVANDI